MNPKLLIITSVSIFVFFARLATAQTAGTVFAWGQNGSGQATIQGTLSGIQAIAAGSDDSTTSIGFSLGLELNGAITGWGNNTSQQLTYPTTNSIYFTAIAAGAFHGVGLSIDGKVYAWGNNANHQTNVPSILSSNVIAIAAGGSGTDNGSVTGTHSLALKNDGTVVSWGKNNFVQTNVPANLSNVVAIAAGGVHSMALKSDGTVVVWGLNTTTNVPAGATNVVAIAAGSTHCLALRTNGLVVNWGTFNGNGLPVIPSSVSNVVAIAAGDQHSMVLRRDGTIVVWGNTNLYSFFLPANFSNVIAIASSGRHALVISNSIPGITVPPRNQSVFPGSKAVFVVMAAGQGTLTYQWQANGINIPGATGPILLLTNAQPANSGFYQVTVRNLNGIATASAGLTLLDGRVSITQQPALTNSVDANSNLTVSVAAVGAIPLSYQWLKDGSIITGATNASYTITNAQYANNGGYSVIVSNGYGAVMSSTNNVGVFYHAPVFVTQPNPTNVPVGRAFQLSASVTGTSPFGWQWRTNGIPIAGATNTNYIVNAAQPSDAATYDVVVTNSSGNGVNATNSNQAIVNVGFVPVVVSSPMSVTNNIGDTASFSCLVTGTPPISLQWTLNGYTLANQTNFILTLTNVQSTNIGFYALTATNIFGSAQSSNASLNVNGFNFSLWAGLEAYYPLDGGLANDASGNGNDGTPIGAGVTSDRFGNTNGAMLFNGIGDYIQCKIGAYFGTNFTISAWVNESTYNPWSRIVDFGNGAGIDNTLFAISDLNSGRPDLEVYVGGTTRLGANDSSNPVIPLHTWMHLVATWNGRQIFYYYNGIQQPGYNVQSLRGTPVTTNNYIGKSNWPNPPNVDQNFAGSFDDIRILNRALSANEVAQLFALEADMPVITQQPQEQIVNAGSTVTFSVIATANHPLTYQWRTNDVPMIGATNSILTLSNVQSANIGFYSVMVSNTVAGVASSGALLNLTGAADPTTNGLIAYYPLNGNANDAGTNGLNGTNNGTGTFWTTNRFGIANSALGLDGSTGYMAVSDPNALLNFDVRTNNYTLTGWVFLDAVTNTQQITVDRGYKNSGDISSYSVRFDSGSDSFLFELWDGTHLYQLFGTRHVAAGQWYQFGAVVNNLTVYTYLNGQADNAGQVTAGFGSTKNTEGLRDFGRMASGLFQDYLAGNLDDLRIYNRALSADEVAYLYALESKSTVPPTPTLSANLGPGPSLNLNLTGSPGSNYVLQAATNLTPPVQWLPVLTNAANTNGVWQFADTNLNSAQKFYRVTTP